MEAAFRIINGRRLWVEERGEGPLVVCVHGLGGTSNVFDPQADALSAAHRVVMFDFSGHGMSELASETSIDGWAADVVALLDDLGAPSCHLVAHSLGTLIAQRVIELAGDRVDSVVLLGPVRNLPDAARAAQSDRAAAVRADGMFNVAHGISRGALSKRTLAEKPEVTAFVRELLQRQPAEGYAAACEALGASMPPHVFGYTGRVLAITGTEDAVSPAERIGDFASEFQSAETVVIDDIGHWTTLEAPLEVNEHLVRFITSQGEST